jgi:hypothetical protein
MKMKNNNNLYVCRCMYGGLWIDLFIIDVRYLFNIISLSSSSSTSKSSTHYTLNICYILRHQVLLLSKNNPIFGLLLDRSLLSIILFLSSRRERGGSGTNDVEPFVKEAEAGMRAAEQLEILHGYCNYFRCVFLAA